MKGKKKKSFFESFFNANTHEIDKLYKILVGDRNENQPLYQAALRGDWEEARRFLDQHPEAATAIVAPFSSTALHVAASEGHSEFVANIVELMPADTIARFDAYGRTALHLGAYAGISPKAAKAMVSKNPDLPNIVSGEDGWCPLVVSAHHGSKSKDLVWYLCMVTKDVGISSPFTGPSAGTLVLTLTAAGYLGKSVLKIFTNILVSLSQFTSFTYYKFCFLVSKTDILLCLIEHYPGLSTVTTPDGVSIFHTLTVTPFSFLSGSRLGWWDRLIYSCNQSFLFSQTFS